MTPSDGKTGAAPTLPSRGSLGRFRLWLAPGMGVKRHVVLAIASALLAIVGVIGGVLWLLADTRSTLAEPVESVLVSPAWRGIGGWLALLTVAVGATASIVAIARLNRSLLSHWLPQPKDAALHVHRRLHLSRGPKIVAFGGGTGLSNLLRGLRSASSNLTGVVTVADDGGSSGRLREAFGMPAPGDLSDCLAALSDDEIEVGRLMSYRFVRGAEFEGHTFGNLLITTLNEVEGDIGKATRVLNRMLNIAGAVWPVTDRPVALSAVKADGAKVHGESRLHLHGGPIERLFLEPADAPALPEVVDAIADAELIVLGPGSLFTSVIAPLLVNDVRIALERTAAPIVYVCNIMTEAGETDGFDAFDHVRTVHDHLGRWPDLVLVNDAAVDPERLEAYRSEAAETVVVSSERFREAGIGVRRAPLLGSGPYAQHASDRLADELVTIALAARAGSVLA